MKALFGTQGRAFTKNVNAACAVNQFESHVDKRVRCEAEGDSLRPNVAPQAPWRGAQARGHLWCGAC